MRSRIIGTLDSLRHAELARDGGMALFVAMMLVNAANFLFNVIMSRMLGAAHYGALGSVLGIVSVLGVIVGGIQLAVTQAVAEREATTRSRVTAGKALLAAAALGLVALGAISAMSPLLSSFLHLSSLLPVVLLAIYIGPSVAGLVPMGVLIGEHRFRAVSAAVLAGVAARLVVGIVLVVMGMGLDGALLASVVSTLLTLAMLTWPLRQQLGLREGQTSLGVKLGPAALSLVGLGGLSFFTMIDSLLARHYLPAVEAGYYVAGATAARISLFLPGAVGLIAFPKLVAARASGTDPSKVLRQSLGLIAVLGGLTALVMVAVPGLVVSMLFGSTYAPAAPVLRVLGLAAAAMSLIGQLIYIHVARHSIVAAGGWIGTAGAVALIAAFHGSALSLAWAMIALAGVLLVMMVLPVLGRKEAANGAGRLVPTSGEISARGIPNLDLDSVVPYDKQRTSRLRQSREHVRGARARGRGT